MGPPVSVGLDRVGPVYSLPKRRSPLGLGFQSMVRVTRQILVGRAMVGGGAPVSIQTMVKSKTHDLEAALAELSESEAAGCDIARVAIADRSAIAFLEALSVRTALPLVADVHFDPGLAVEAARRGAAGLRVNPGTLGGDEDLRQVVQAARAARIPLRIGVNAGSLPRGIRADSLPEAMVGVARAAVAFAEAEGLLDLKVSLKAFGLAETQAACRRFADLCDVPLHLGVTEAGPLLQGAVRSAAALAPLLQDGIGETLRISLAAPAIEEVRAARHLLVALGLRRGPAVVACPGCGRSRAAVFDLAARVERRLEVLGLPRTVAVMGCEVNGPGEARSADVGIAFGGSGRGALFEGGQVVQGAPNDRLEDLLFERLQALALEED